MRRDPVADRACFHKLDGACPSDGRDVLLQKQSGAASSELEIDAEGTLAALYSAGVAHTSSLANTQTARNVRNSSKKLASMHCARTYLQKEKASCHGRKVLGCDPVDTWRDEKRKDAAAVSQQSPESISFVRAPVHILNLYRTESRPN